MNFLTMPAAACCLGLACMVAAAQPVAPATPPPAAETAAATPAPYVSALDAPTFYEVVTGELSLMGRQAATGMGLLLDAANRSGDERLYQRALEAALQSRSGDAALQAGRAWKQAHPQSLDASAYLIQVLIVLNRVEETADIVAQDLAGRAPEVQLNILSSLPRSYARAPDRAQAAAIVEQVVAALTAQPETAAGAYVITGLMYARAGDEGKALENLKLAYQANPQYLPAAGLALELMSPARPQAEALLQRQIGQQPLPELRMVYAKALIEANRPADARQQLQQATAAHPDMAQAWLVLGALEYELKEFAAAERSLQRFLSLADSRPQAFTDLNRARQQAYMQMAQLAERRKDSAAADAWLARIDDPDAAQSVQVRRATMLARRGQLDQARQIVRGLPERSELDRSLKLLTEVQILRDARQYRPAYDLLVQASASDPQDTELMYQQSLMAEKLGLWDEAERLLRRIIEIKPSHADAYNALGYSLTERNTRLPEAKGLIEKALELKPGNAMIEDSLGWVLFRLGEHADALRHLEQAFKTMPDPEIAAHLGEVLWVMGQRDKARAIWKEGLMIQSDHEALLETMKRFSARP